MNIQPEMLTANEADKAFRVAKGTCRSLYDLGRVRGRPSRQGRNGTLYLNREDLIRELGGNKAAAL